jgi:hypothetical protein
MSLSEIALIVWFVLYAIVAFGLMPIPSVVMGIVALLFVILRIAKR